MGEAFGMSVGISDGIATGKFEGFAVGRAVGALKFAEDSAVRTETNIENDKHRRNNKDEMFISKLSFAFNCKDICRHWDTI